MSGWVAEHRRRQGLPPTIEDQATRERLAILLRPRREVT